MEVLKNNHKIKGAFVWYDDEIRYVTKCDTDIEGDLILDNLDRVRRNQVTLVKIGDPVRFKPSLVNTLPDRITFGKRLITHIRSNGLIGTNKDANEFDDSHYKYFERWGNPEFKEGKETVQNDDPERERPAN